MYQKSSIERIELEYDEYYTQLNELNRISELPDQMEFKVSPLYKLLFFFLVIGVGITGGIYSVFNDRFLYGALILIGAILVAFILYYQAHKPRERNYVVSKTGLSIDDQLYHWKEIEDLHLRLERLTRGQLVSICFVWRGINKEYPLDSMTKSNGEITQILYLYQQWWIKNEGK